MNNVPEKPHELSDNAFTVLIEAYRYFEKNDAYFTDFSSLDFPREELERCFLELHEKRYVFWEDRGKENEYLYILDNPLLDNFL